MAISESLGDVVVYIRAKFDKFRKDLKKATSDVKRSTKTMGDSFRSMRAEIGLATVAIGGLGASVLKAAGDMEEMQDKFDEVFRTTGNSVKKWSQEFGKAVGRSSLKLQGAAADTQSLLLSSGIAEKEATKLSMAMTELAIDTASFNNATDPDAIAAFQKALLGEKEALKGVGVSLLETEVKQAALAEGIIKTKRELTPTERALATYAALAKKTAVFQGNAAKTSESFTNKLKAAGDAVFDLKVNLGNELLPTATEFLDAFTDMPPKLQAVTVGVGLLTASMAILGGKITAIVTAIGLAIAGFKKLKDMAPKFDSASDDPAAFFGRGGGGFSKGLPQESGGGQIANKVMQISPSDAESSPMEKVVDSPKIAELMSTGITQGADDAINTTAPKFTELSNTFGSSVGDSLKSAMSSAIQSGDVKGALEGFGQSLFRKVTDSLLDAVFTGLSGAGGGAGGAGGGGGFLSGIFGSFFGAKALGGSVSTNKPYLVGERGPEMFVPQSRGAIVPNNAMSSGGTSVVMNNNFAGVSAVNRQELNAALARQQQQIMSSIQKKSRSGGSFARNLRGE